MFDTTAGQIQEAEFYRIFQSRIPYISLHFMLLFNIVAENILLLYHVFLQSYVNKLLLYFLRLLYYILIYSYKLRIP
jgi:N-dimethylarginine dimethylaminohydrolase